MCKPILQTVQQLQPALIEAIIQITSVASVQSVAEEGEPYGKNVALALNKTLNLAQSLGFTTYNGLHWGYAEWGKEEDYIGVFGHLDVVEPGEGWQITPPFKPIIKENYLYGRGVLDNKGPILSCLFALKALKDAGVHPKKTIRIVFGCNEESGFADMHHYLANQKAPLMGFTPDCKFPVVYAERGRLKLTLSATKQNASFLYSFVTTYFLQANQTGNRLGINLTDAEFGQLEIKDYKLYQQNEEVVFSFAISYPPSTTETKLINTIKSLLPKEINLKKILNYNPVKFNKDSFLVQALTQAYNQVTGQNLQPVTTTGGTYAKIVPNIVPFGPSFAGQKNIAHNPDEWLNLTDLLTITQIYATALYNLTC